MKLPIRGGLVAFALVVFTSLLLGQNLAEDVLKGKEIQGIEFKSYVGPHQVIESRAAIQGIGSALGTQLKTGSTKADYGSKYSIQRVVDLSSPLLSADLLVLSSTAGVDHIRNLGWIISAYLQEAFAYNQADADLLADFVCRYNAFYRGKTDYFPQAYGPSVVSCLVPPEITGLSLDYRDWPGKTRMLIPLRSSLSKGVAGGVNTEEISNKDIVKDMGSDPAALDTRKKLADLKEAEIVQEQKAVAQKEATLTAPTAAGTTPPTTPTPSATTTPTAPAADTAAKALDQAKADVAARDQALQAERKDIVASQPDKTAAASTPVTTKPPITVPVVIVADASKLGQVELVDPAANKVWKRSELNSVRAARVQVFGDGFLVTAGDTKVSNGAVRLMLLNKDDLSVSISGTDEISADSPVVIVGTQVLALTQNEKGLWVLGLFDGKLKALAKGTDTLQASTGIVSGPTGVFVQANNGKLMLLDAATLKKKSDTED